MSYQFMMIFMIDSDVVSEGTASGNDPSFPYNLPNQNHHQANIVNQPIFLQFREEDQLYNVLHQCTPHCNDIMLANKKCCEC